MSALSQMLERLRRMRPPPGRAAGVVAVPSAGDELSAEVAFLFGELDAIADRKELILASARSEAAEIVSAAKGQRTRLLADARIGAERTAAELLAERRARSEERASTMLADAVREAERVRARGRERTPAFAALVLGRVLERTR